MESREDVDDLLELYLEGPVDIMKKDDCDERHDDMEKDWQTKLSTVAATVESRIKLWILGALAGAVVAVVSGTIGAYSCAIVEAGAYRERVDNNGKQLDKLEQSTTRQMDELKVEIRAIRDILLNRRTP